MWLSWRWVGEMVDTAGVDPRAFVDRFVLAVAEIEGVRVIGPGLEPVQVGVIRALRPHPDADKLRIASVDVGPMGVIDVVCGAPDLAIGMVVPFVPPGTRLPSGVEVRDGAVRGVRSPGMLASEKDLGLSEEHGGLLRLDGCEAAAGAPLLDVLAIADVLYEIDNKSLTHRPDLWGQVGLAREIAALLDRPLRLPATDVAFAAAAALAGRVTVAADAACPRYLAATFDGVQVAPSPVATRLRLRSLGVRPIDNVVDATNLVMLETGNPLHAFDARFVRGGALAVRRARDGETIRTLDGQTRLLRSSDVVIVDGEGPVALAGIMGGADAEIRGDTTALVLEAANFDGATIRRTSARLGLRSESSARFEKGLDPAIAEFAARRFAATLAELCPGARPSSALADLGAGAAREATTITTSREHLRQRLGLDASALPDLEVDAILGRLGFGVVGALGATMAVTVPSFRAGRDVAIVEDLVEELGRQYGYDRIPSQPMRAAAAPAPLPPMRRLERRLRSLCALGRGLLEVQLYSFDHEPLRDRLGLAARDDGGSELPRVLLANTLSSEQVALRRELAPGLLQALERNLGHGLPGAPAQKGLRLGLFELGRVYLPERATASDDVGLPPALRGALGPGARAAFLDLLGPALAADATAAAAAARPLPLEPRRLAIAIGERLGGEEAARPPAVVTEALFRAAIGAVEAICAGLGVTPPRLRRGDRGDAAVLAAATPRSGLDVAPGWLHPARHAWIVAEDGAGGWCRLGLVSMLHPRARVALEVPAEVVVVELDLDALLPLVPAAAAAGAPPRLPGSEFDLTVPARADVAADAVRAVVAEALAIGAAETFERCSLVARFDTGAAAHPAAITLRVGLRRGDRTIDSADIQQARALAVAALLSWSSATAVDAVPALASDLAARLGVEAPG